MAKVISTTWVKSTVLGVFFGQEKRGDNFVGVAEMSDEEAQKFVGRDGFTVEGLEPEAPAKLTRAELEEFATLLELDITGMSDEEAEAAIKAKEQEGK
jgi:hypothetical protein